MSRLSRILNVFRSARVEDELDEELRFHLDERARQLMAGGMAEAKPTARRGAGSATPSSFASTAAT